MTEQGEAMSDEAIALMDKRKIYCSMSDPDYAVGEWQGHTRLVVFLTLNEAKQMLVLLQANIAANEAKQ